MLCATRVARTPAYWPSRRVVSFHGTAFPSDHPERFTALQLHPAANKAKTAAKAAKNTFFIAKPIFIILFQTQQGYSSRRFNNIRPEKRQKGYSRCVIFFIPGDCLPLRHLKYKSKDTYHAHGIQPFPPIRQTGPLRRCQSEIHPRELLRSHRRQRSRKIHLSQDPLRRDRTHQRVRIPGKRQTNVRPFPGPLCLRRPYGARYRHFGQQPPLRDKSRAGTPSMPNPTFRTKTASAPGN